MDFRGDPSSALLEVLDPEQNHTFNDHYLEVDYDLSDVMFVATANTLNIPAPLLDRMEVIRLSGLHRGREGQHRAALPGAQADEEQRPEGRASSAIAEAAMRDIIRYYTREAGVRSLEREIAKICRKVVQERACSTTTTAKVVVTPENLEKYLGVQQVPLRPGRGGEPGRPGHRAGLDRGRRRAADHRGGGRAGQGQAPVTPASSAT